MIGQKKLIENLNKFNLDTFPKSVLLLGEEGCGKHTYLNLIANKLNIPLLNITDLIDFDYILNMYSRSILSIYYIDIDNFTDKKQNVILKLLEEPPNTAFIVLVSSDKSLILPTIINRCSVFEFEKYSKQELENFIESGDNKELLCEIFTTPGQILAANTDNINSLYNLCLKIVNKIQISSYPNALSISEKINYNDKYDKFNLVSFFRMINHVILEEYITTSNNKLIEYMNITNDYQNKLSHDKRLDKQKLFENYIGKLWMVSKWN